jgi:hypothetical protein
MRALFVILLISTYVASSQAAEHYLSAEEFASQLAFGSEMTMTNEELMASYPTDGNTVRVSTPLANSYVARMRAATEERYRGSGISLVLNDKTSHSNWPRIAYSLDYPDGFRLTVFPDPGVLELNSSPSSLTVLEKNAERIQSDYFDEGRKLGLAPAAFAGSGHIHMEVTKLHPVTVRNFLASFFNATGLSAGGLNEDVFNAIGPGEMPAANKKLLKSAFENFDRLKDPTTEDLKTLISVAYEIPFSADLPEYQSARNGQRPQKYFAVSFKSFEKLGTIEFRAIRPQTSAESYIKLVRLFVARMKIAEAQRIAGERVAIGKLPSLRGKPRAIIEEFDRYVSETGLDFNSYREFVLPWWQSEGAEVDQYLEHKRSAAHSCGVAILR